MKRVLGFSLAVALILAGVHVVANPNTTAKATKAAPKVAAAKGKVKRLPACPTCVNGDNYPPNESFDGDEVRGLMHQYTRCVDFDNVAPGHCSTVNGRSWTIVSRAKPHVGLAMFVLYACRKADPGPVACGSPGDPPYMANPHPVSQQQYWLNYGVGGGTGGGAGGGSCFTLPYFRKPIVQANRNTNAKCKCSVPNTN